MHVISKRSFIEASARHPNQRDALLKMYKTLSSNSVRFESPDEMRRVFPSLDNFSYVDKMQEPSDIAMLRVLMDQHGLGVADFPEIGDKSLLSRILSGSRNLTKQHIKKLSRRFGVEPGMFFEAVE